MDQTLRDAELRVRFAEIYLSEVNQEYMRSPAAWKEILAQAQHSLAIARANYQRVLERSNGELKCAVA